MKRNVFIGAGFIALLSALGVSQSVLEKKALAQAGGGITAPRFEVDPMWPKPLPNGWYIGQTIGVWADTQDHVWIIHRNDSLDPVEAAADQNPPTGECCKKAPPIIEFDLDTIAGANSFPTDFVVERTASADMIVDGTCIWFEAQFDDHTVLSTSPLSPLTSWGNRLYRLDRLFSKGEQLRIDVHLPRLLDPDTWLILAS